MVDLSPRRWEQSDGEFVRVIVEVVPNPYGPEHGSPVLAVDFTVALPSGWDTETLEPMLTEWDGTSAVVASGFVKWDGCSHYWLGERDAETDKHGGYFHFDDAADLEWFCRGLVKARQMAREILESPGNAYCWTTAALPPVD